MKERVAAAIEGQDADWSPRRSATSARLTSAPWNSPYQFIPIGTEENVNSFTPEQIRKWYADQIVCVPRVLAIYGDVTLDTAKDLANKYVGQGPKPTGSAA